MPDETRMDGIADQLNGDSDDADESTDANDADESSDASESRESLTSEGAGEGKGDEPQSFTHGESDKTTVYGTEETIADYRDHVEKVQATAVAELDLNDVAGREVHNAILELAFERDASDVAERIEANRDA